MEITGPLAVQFYNYGQDKYDRPEQTKAADYHRVKGCWNIYFHGFMDRYDDIAYTKAPTVIEPGIYEIETYGVKAYLYLWDTKDQHHRPLKGLIVRRDDVAGMADAQKKYDENQAFI